MSKKEGVKVYDSLQDLAKALSAAPMLDLPEPDLESVDDLEEGAKKIRERAQKAGEWVGNNLALLDRIKTASREAQEMVADKVNALRKKISDLRDDKTPAYRRAARLSHLKHAFSGDIATGEELKTLLERLCQEGFLCSDPEGYLEIWRKRFSVSADSYFGSEEIKDVTRTFESLHTRIWQEVGKARARCEKMLFEKATISVAELVDGERGISTLHVPTERYEENGQERFRGGGVLCVSSDGRRIFPSDVSGSIERVIRETMGAGVFVFVDSLGWERPPYIRDLGTEAAKKLQLFWRLIKRGIQAEEDKLLRQELKLIREEFGKSATITQEQFFLENKEGVCLAEYDPVWRSDGVTFRDIFLLVKRARSEDGTAIVRIVRIPDHLRDFFSPCVSEEGYQEYQEEGEKYRGLPYPLLAVLQAIHGQVKRNARTKGTR